METGPREVSTAGSSLWSASFRRATVISRRRTASPITGATRRMLPYSRDRTRRRPLFSSRGRSRWRPHCASAGVGRTRPPRVGRPWDTLGSDVYTPSLSTLSSERSRSPGHPPPAARRTYRWRNTARPDGGEDHDRPFSSVAAPANGRRSRAGSSDRGLHPGRDVQILEGVMQGERVTRSRASPVVGSPRRDHGAAGHAQISPPRHDGDLPRDRGHPRVPADQRGRLVLIPTCRRRERLAGELERTRW